MSIGVALAGGGLKGLAHIGALQALEELGIDIDFLSGTSSGSLFATLYALGYTTEEIKNITLENYKLITKIRKKAILKGLYSFLRTGVVQMDGLVDGNDIEKIIKKYADKKSVVNMNDLKIAYAISSVDTISTKQVIFLSKEIANEEKVVGTEEVDYVYGAPISLATRASMAFPGIYTPCQYQKYNFIDGGTKDNLPIHVLKNMGAKKTIALSFKIDDYKPKKDILAILLRTCDIFSLKDVRKAQKEADLSIEIDAKGASLLEINNAEQMVNQGYTTIMNHKNEIYNLIRN